MNDGYEFRSGLLWIGDIEMITDYNNKDLLIKEYGCSYPVRIYNTSRAAIGNKKKQALKMLKQALRE